MVKLVVFAIIAIAACRMLFHRWPWEMWQASERSQSEAQARVLLGVDRAASSEEIVAAHRRKLREVHPDKGGSSEAVHAIDRARDVLLEQRQRERR